MGSQVYVAWDELSAVLCDAGLGALSTQPALTEEQAAARKTTVLRFVLRDADRYRATHPEFMAVGINQIEPGQPGFIQYVMLGSKQRGLPEVLRTLVRMGAPHGVRVVGTPPH